MAGDSLPTGRRGRADHEMMEPARKVDTVKRSPLVRFFATKPLSFAIPAASPAAGEIVRQRAPVMSVLAGEVRQAEAVLLDVPVQQLLAEWLGRVGVPGNVRVQVDIDPYSFL